MTTPAGQISFSDIQTEFGPNVGSEHNLGQYRVNQSIAGRNWPLDDNVPIPGQSISFSQLRGKTVNVVVDYSGETETTMVSSDEYPDGVVVGGFINLPSNTVGNDTKKVRNVIRKTIGGTLTVAALRTGDWTPNTQLFYYVTSTGRIYGRGGAGGGGGFPGGNGEAGGDAFFAEYDCTITVESSGQLRGGGGGGGGGGSYSFNQNVPIGNFACSSNGGTGGTGRGINNISGSTAGQGMQGNCRGSDSQAGDGGDWGQEGEDGTRASSTGPIGGETEVRGGGGQGGAAGDAIIKDAGVSVTLINNGIVSGATNL